MGFVRLLFGVGCGLGLFASSGWADDAPAPRVGRVAAISGAVQYRSPTGDWASALVNEPVAASVGVRCGADAVAALRIAGDRIALAGSSEVKFIRLDRDVLEIAVPQGRVGVHLAGDTATTVEIDLPTGGVWLAAPGNYDLAAGDSRSPARIETFAGKVELGGGLQDTVIATASPDDFDAKWMAEDKSGAAAPPLPRALTGGAALAANGDWEHDDIYGHAWYPKGLPADWMPYRYGQWRYLPPWGWTWIDAADWGFAPAHYGGWERVGERWAWVPGPQGDDPSYSPAKVAFLGTPGIGLSRPGSDGAAVAWFPLAPDEAVGDGEDAHFRNRRAASIVPRAVFAGGQPAQPALLDLPEWRLDDAPVIVGGVGIPPIGNGGSGYVAETPPVPILEARVVSVLLAVTAPRQPLLSRVHDLLASAVTKRLPAATAAVHRWRAAAAIVVRPGHPTHNRPHLAANRGGAQLR